MKMYENLVHSEPHDDDYKYVNNDNDENDEEKREI